MTAKNSFNYNDHWWKVQNEYCKKHVLKLQWHKNAPGYSIMT